MAASDQLTAHFHERHTVTLLGARVWVRNFPGDEEAQAMVQQAIRDARRLLTEMGPDLEGEVAVAQALEESATYRAMGEWYIAESIEYRGKKHGKECAMLASNMHRRSADALKAAREAAAAVRERRAQELTADGHEVFSDPQGGEGHPGGGGGGPEGPIPPKAPPGVVSGAPQSPPPTPATPGDPHG